MKELWPFNAEETDLLFMIILASCAVAIAVYLAGNR